MNSAEKQISYQSKSSFYYAFNLLGKEKSEAMNIVYAFCRLTDDIVDENSNSIETRELELDLWEAELKKAINNQSEQDLFKNLVKTINKYQIPKQTFFDLIKGMRKDLKNTRYQTLNELEEYCYDVASTIGIMSVHIFGYENNMILDYAINLGKAFQITNIMRDVKTDAENGRIYIPLEILNKHKYSENELLNFEFNSRFSAVMQELAEVAEKYYTKAEASLAIEDRKKMFAAISMTSIYYSLLKKIIRKHYDIFNNQIKVGKTEKIARSLIIYLKYYLFY